MTNKLPPEIIKQFEDKFVHLGTFGEKRLNLIFATYTTKNDPIVLDEQVVTELESFITSTYEQAVRAERERTIKILEGMKKEYDPEAKEILFIDPVAVSGYNKAIEDAITKIKQ